MRKNITRNSKKLEILIEKTPSCWRNLRLSTKMVKIYGIEDHSLDQMIEYSGIEYFIEDFIEQTRQFEIIKYHHTMQYCNLASDNY